MEAGLDSIGAVELRNAVSTKFGIELPATATFDYPSADALARFVVGQTAPVDQFFVGQSFGQQQPAQAVTQPMVDQKHIAAQLAATVSELLGFEVPADQVRAYFSLLACKSSLFTPPELKKPYVGIGCNHAPFGAMTAVRSCVTVCSR